MKIYAFNCAKYTAQVNRIKEDAPELIKGFPTIVFYRKGAPVEEYGQNDEERKIGSLLKKCMEVCQSKKK